MEKRGQLGVIEFKYFMYGLLLGIVGGFALVFLGTRKIIPFKIPIVCGLTLPGLSSLFSSKKGQLGILEFQYFMVGFGIGIVVGLVLVYLGTAKIIPFKIPVVCG